MPNWCENQVRINGPVDKIYDMAKAMEREELLQQLHALNVDGVILSNTQKTQEPFAGGKSGLPLRESSLNIIRACREQLPKTTIIASGGIGLDGDTQTFVEAGADLIQIWTALVYRGPSLLRNL